MSDGRCYFFTDGGWSLCVFAVNIKDARKYAGTMAYKGKRFPNECPAMTCGSITQAYKDQRKKLEESQ